MVDVDSSSHIKKLFSLEIFTCIFSISVFLYAFSLPAELNYFKFGYSETFIISGTKINTLRSYIFSFIITSVFTICTICRQQTTEAFFVNNILSKNNNKIETTRINIIIIFFLHNLNTHFSLLCAFNYITAQVDIFLWNILIGILTSFIILMHCTKENKFNEEPILKWINDNIIRRVRNNNYAQIEEDEERDSIKTLDIELNTISGNEEQINKIIEDIKNIKEKLKEIENKINIS